MATSNEPAWLALLRAAVNAAQSMRAVGNTLGYSPTSISQVLAGNYAGKTTRIETRVIEVYGQRTCPHTGLLVTALDCHAASTARAPTHNPMRITAWRACQTCSHATARGGNNDD